MILWKPWERRESFAGGEESREAVGEKGSGEREKG